MKIRLLVFITLLISLPLQAQNTLDPDLIDDISRSVVTVVSLQDGEAYEFGSGTIVERTGRIYTNRHVVENGDDFAILILEDPNELPVLRYFASIEAIYPEEVDEALVDFAILQIDRDENGDALEAASLNLPAIAVSNAEPARRGEPIFVFGYPGTGDGYLVFTNGIVTTVQNSSFNGTRLQTLYQTNAEISPGNSGGLAVNSDGRPLGIPTFVNTEFETGGRLGGIQPFKFLNTIIQSDVETSTTNQRAVTESNLLDAMSTDDRELLEEFSGIEIQCTEDLIITNGIEILLPEIRPQVEYTITVIGLDGFDPLLAATETLYEETYTNTIAQLCSDDDRDAAEYELNLPTMGNLSGNSRSAQIEFSYDGEAAFDLSLIVGEYDGNGGEFVLVIEGARIDPDSISSSLAYLYLTPNLFLSGIPAHIYMIAEDAQLDPLFYLYDIANEETLRDRRGERYECDDADDAELCYPTSGDLSDGFVRGLRNVPTNGLDALMSIDLADTIAPFQWLPFVFTSYSGDDEGNYIIIMHLGIE